MQVTNLVAIRLEYNIVCRISHARGIRPDSAHGLGPRVRAPDRRRRYRRNSVTIITTIIARCRRRRRCRRRWRRRTHNNNIIE